MITTPNLGLKVWNLSTDPYNSGQLADNWARVDEHDHSNGKGRQVPTGGIADGAVTPAKLSSAIDYEYAFSTYKIVAPRVTGAVVSGKAVATYLLGDDSPNGEAVVASAAAVVQTFLLPRFEPSDFTAGSRGNKLRVRAQIFTNAVAPAATFTVGLYPVATFGGASANPPHVATLSAVVAGSTVAFATPGASSQTAGNSGDFTAPAAGYYVLAVATTGGTTAANSQTQIIAELQRREV